MKFVCVSLFIGLVLLATTSGCVQSHRAPPSVVYTAPPTPTVVYTPPPTPTVVAPPQPPPYTPAEPPPAPPTSRVFTVPEAEVSPPSEPPPGVSSQDLAIAEAISKLLKNDPHMASISGNVQATIDQGVVSLRGTVPSGNAMDEIAMRIAKLPGVAHIENHLSVSNR